MRRYYLLSFLTLIIFSAWLTGLKLVRASLLTNYVTSTITYILTGPAFATCATVPNSDRQITVSWQDQDNNEAGFFIDRIGSDGSQIRLQAPPAPGNNSVANLIDTRAVPDTQYTYTVKSFLGPVESTGQTTPTPCSTQGPPVQPSNIQAIGSSQTSINLTWRISAIIAAVLFYYGSDLM